MQIRFWMYFTNHLQKCNSHHKTRLLSRVTVNNVFTPAPYTVPMCGDPVVYRCTLPAAHKALLHQTNPSTMHAALHTLAISSPLLASHTLSGGALSAAHMRASGRALDPTLWIRIHWIHSPALESHEFEFIFRRIQRVARWLNYSINNCPWSTHTVT